MANDEGDTSWQVSLRQKLTTNEPMWPYYFANHPFPQVEELRTIDICFNPVIDGSYQIDSLEELDAILQMLPSPVNDQYLMVITDALANDLPEGHDRLQLLGHDLSDWTSVSTLTNCGTWLDELATIAQSVNRYGLLDLEQAKRAREILPELWNNDPHSFVTIWAVYEITARRSS